MLVSFIIPAYNSAEYICTCLASIYNLNLSRNDFEVIVVDDCSLDNTYHIIEQYRLENGFENLVLLRQEQNHRQGAARNRGIAIAKGKYICFVDSDDEVYDGIVDALFQAEKHCLEMVALHTVHMDARGSMIPMEKLKYQEDDVFSGIQFQSEYPIWHSVPWGYVYLKEFLDRVNYPFAEDVLYEDADYVFRHLFSVCRLGYCSTCGYCSKYRESSTTCKLTSKNTADYFLLGTRMIKIGDDFGAESKLYADLALEGGGHNIMKACRLLIKLASISDVRSFYQRIDSRIVRKDYLKYRYPREYWNFWTRLCISERMVTMTILSLAIPVYKIYVKLRKTI